MAFQTWIAANLRAYGLPTEEYSSWTTRGSSSFDPHGVVCHWTAGPCHATGRPSLSTVVNGRPDLSGPLANVYLDRWGVCVVVAAGRANHAGDGGWQGLSGNSSVFGIEAEACGDGDWTPDQRAAYPRLVAALLDGVGRDASYACGHNEWAPSRKIDIRDWPMPLMRDEVALELVGGAPPPADEQIPGGFTMFIAIDSVALCALMGNVLFTFPDMKQYGNAKNASENVPAIVIGADVPAAARGDLYEQLLRQHIVAVGEGDNLP